MLSLSLSSQLHGVHFTFGLTWVCGRRLRPLSYFSKQHGVSAWASFVASLILFWTTRCECVDVFCGLVFFWTTLCECVDVFCGLSHFILNNTVWVCGRLLWPLSFYSEQHCVSVWATFVASLILFFILNNTVWVCGHLWRALSFYSKQHGVSVWTFFVASHFIFYSEQHGVSVWTSFVASHFILNNTVWVCGRLFVASFSSEQQCECVDVFCGLSRFLLNNTVWVCGRLLWPLSFSSEQHSVNV